MARDFDAFWREQKKEPIVFRAFGEEVILPASIPAEVPIRMLRLQKQYGNDGDIPPTDMLDLALAIFEKERIDRWFAQSITMDQLQDILMWVMGEYSGGKAGTKGAKKKKASPEAQTLTSSPTGDGSKATS